MEEIERIDGKELAKQIEEEIKVGEFVRTKEGYIAKFIHYGINEGINGMSCLFDKAIRDISCLIYDEDNFLFDSELKKYIVKHSSNIIDLIEERRFCYFGI